MMPRISISLRRPAGIVMVVLSAALVAVVFVFVVKWLPQMLATSGLKDKEKAEEIGRVRTATLATLAGVLAAIGAYYTHRTFQLNRESLEHQREAAQRTHALDQARQITERFTRAIDQLGSDKLDVRLGGIYALERIGRDSEADHPQVVEVLTAYVRGHAGRRPDHRRADAHGAAAAEHADDPGDASPPPGSLADRGSAETYAGAAQETGKQRPSDAQTAPHEMPTDVQAVMSVLGRRETSHDRADAPLDLTFTDLRRLVLHGDQAHLEGAQFWESDLQLANLSGAQLEGADFYNSDLRAYLHQANLQRANLYNADLRGATLTEAKLQAAELFQANLQGANLTDAELQRAVLRSNLGGANLNGTNLQGTDLRDAFLDGATLQGARYDVTTQWPEDFKPTDHGARLVNEDTVPRSEIVPR